MKGVIIIFGLVLMFGCENIDSNEILNNEKTEIINDTIFDSFKQKSKLDTTLTLNFVRVNDRCGEWGGDKEKIIIYSKGQSKKIFADYSISASTCSIPEENLDLSKYYCIYGVELTDKFDILIKKTISDLSESPKTNGYCYNFGFSNKVWLSDSSVVISEYSANVWSSFDVLKDSILNSNVSPENNCTINGVWKGFSGAFTDSIWSYGCYTPDQMEYYEKGEHYMRDEISLTIMNDSFYFDSGRIWYNEYPLHYESMDDNLVDSANIQILIIEKLNNDSLVCTITIPGRMGVVDLKLKRSK